MHSTIQYLAFYISINISIIFNSLSRLEACRKLCVTEHHFVVIMHISYYYEDTPCRQGVDEMKGTCLKITLLDPVQVIRMCYGLQCLINK